MPLQKKTIFAFILAVILSCDQNTSGLEVILVKSGTNRSELEKVLEVYSVDKKDSLKLKAAIYLINHMPGHLSLSGPTLHQHQDKLKELLISNSTDEVIFQEIESFQLTDSILKEDIQVITSDVLINTIDKAFDTWQNKTWCQHLNFDEFCEYILPYKYVEYQVLDHWRDTLTLKFNNSINQVFENDETYSSPYHIGRLINREINDRISIKLDEGKIALSPFFRSDLIYKIPFGNCNDYSALILATMRSHGVPATIDFIPQWGHKDGGNHKWISILNKNGKHLPIPHLHQDPGDVFFPMHIFPKIYRQTYAEIPDRAEYMKKSSYIFDNLTQFHKDVTSEYTTTSDLNIPIRIKNIQDKYAFIACSSQRIWNVVDFGKIKNNKACFLQMGRNVVYLVLGYDGKKLIPIADPFFLDKDGNIRYFTPDTTTLREITLWRKYPKKEHVAHMESRIIGGELQASNDPKLKEWVTLYEIRDNQYPNKIEMGATTEYRYWRFFRGKYAYMNIAELQFYPDDSEQLATGKIIGSAGLFKEDSTYSHAKAFDGDWFTHYHSPDASGGSWVGLDLQTPKKIKYARCIARSDDNEIRYGDTYELVYWINGEWESLGIQTAKERFLVFDSVPGNTLLLLKNISRGKDERIFTYEEGKQVWW